MGDRYLMNDQGQDEEQQQTGFEGVESAVDQTQADLDSFRGRMESSGYGEIPVDMEADLQSQMQSVSGPMAGIESLGWKAQVPAFVPGDLAEVPEEEEYDEIDEGEEYERETSPMGAMSVKRMPKVRAKVRRPSSEVKRI